MVDRRMSGSTGAHGGGTAHMNEKNSGRRRQSPSPASSLRSRSRSPDRRLSSPGFSPNSFGGHSNLSTPNQASPERLRSQLAQVDRKSRNESNDRVNRLIGSHGPMSQSRSPSMQSDRSRSPNRSRSQGASTVSLSPDASPQVCCC